MRPGRWLLLAGLWVGPSVAQAPPAVPSATGKPVEVITPVFHQLVAFEVPGSFRFDALEQANDKLYLRESVPRNETPERWTQMITLTGARGAAAKATPERFLENIAANYKQACPQSFAIKPIGATKISGAPAYLALVSCGSAQDENGAKGAMHSETALLAAIAGDQDLYTIQWAERGTPSAAPLTFDEARWQARFRSLGPIRVCARVPGEQAPYRSCLQQH